VRQKVTIKKMARRKAIILLHVPFQLVSIGVRIFYFILFYFILFYFLKK
jgi:hypothetical protein